MKKTRYEEIFESIRKFSDDDKKVEMTMELSKVEMDILKGQLYEQDIEMEIIKENILEDGRLEITLKKP